MCLVRKPLVCWTCKISECSLHPSDIFRIQSFKWKHLLLLRCDKDQRWGGIWWEQKQRLHLGRVGLATELVLGARTMGIRTVSTIGEGSWSITFHTRPSVYLSVLLSLGFCSSELYLSKKVSKEIENCSDLITHSRVGQQDDISSIVPCSRS